MKKLLISILTVLALPLMGVETIPLSPGEGEQNFLESAHRSDYWRLINYFETQATNTYCGVASGVMVLNALGIEKPYVERLKHNLFTQEESFFTKSVEEVVSKEQVSKGGMTLPQLAQALETFNVSATELYASDLTLEQFRYLLKTIPVQEENFLIANWHRPLLDQVGGGHFSPIAAYNQTNDLVLILDVSRYKYKPFWVKTEDLFKSMLAQDSDSGRSRGLIHVSKDDTRYS